MVRIMGVDPGLNATGVGIIDALPRQYRFVHGEVIRTGRSQSLPDRLQKIFTDLQEIIDQFRPRFLVVEEIFYSENIKTVLTMGHTRGVILLAGAMQKLEIVSYTPREIKLAVVGTGRASKEQVQYMVQKILGLGSDPFPRDISDALSMAICHAQRINTHD